MKYPSYIWTIPIFNPAQLTDAIHADFIAYNFVSQYESEVNLLYREFVSRQTSSELTAVDAGSGSGLVSLYLASEAAKDGKNLFSAALEFSQLKVHVGRSIVLNKQFYKSMIEKGNFDTHMLYEELKKYTGKLFRDASAEYWKKIGYFYGWGLDHEKIKQKAKEEFNEGLRDALKHFNNFQAGDPLSLPLLERVKSYGSVLDNVELLEWDLVYGIPFKNYDIFLDVASISHIGDTRIRERVWKEGMKGLNHNGLFFSVLTFSESEDHQIVTKEKNAKLLGKFLEDEEMKVEVKFTRKRPTVIARKV